MDNEDKMLASAARRRLDSLSTPRPGGWREERSPDGRMTMYISPKGERLSREEFFDKYPQGTGGSQSIAAGMMKDVASGRSQASIPDQENLKVGVILQPRGKLSDFPDGRPSEAVHYADEQIARVRNDSMSAKGEWPKFMSDPEIREYAAMKAKGLKDYRATEQQMGKPDAMNPSEYPTLNKAKDRAKPIPFPDKK